MRVASFPLTSSRPCVIVVYSLFCVSWSLIAAPRLEVWLAAAAVLPLFIHVTPFPGLSFCGGTEGRAFVLPLAALAGGGAPWCGGGEAVRVGRA